MLGYTQEDLDRMINSVHDAKLFYLRHPSSLMDKEPLRKDLEDTVDCHYLPLNEIQYSNLLNEIEKPYFSNNNKHS